MRTQRIELTRDMAWAIATDAANARMRKAGRSAWTRGDYNMAVKTFNRLWWPRGYFGSTISDE